MQDRQASFRDSSGMDHRVVEAVQPHLPAAERVRRVLLPAQFRRSPRGVLSPLGPRGQHVAGLQPTRQLHPRVGVLHRAQDRVRQRGPPVRAATEVPLRSGPTTRTTPSGPGVVVVRAEEFPEGVPRLRLPMQESVAGSQQPEHQ